METSPSSFQLKQLGWPRHYRTPSYSFPPLYSVDRDDFLLQITSKAGQKESQPMFTMATLWSVNLNLASCWMLCVQSQECLLIAPSSVTVPPSLSKSHITSLTRCAFKWGAMGQMKSTLFLDWLSVGSGKLSAPEWISLHVYLSKLEPPPPNQRKQGGKYWVNGRGIYREREDTGEEPV